MKTVSISFILIVACCIAAIAQGPRLDNVGDKFNFFINADPQIGPADGSAPNERNLYKLLVDFGNEVNGAKPAFVLFNGDLVAFNKDQYFTAFYEATKHITVPVALVHGNHDGRYGEQRFLDVQEKLSGYRALQYSFDCGKWHFVVMPGKEMIPSEKEEDFFAWLDADLQANRDKPTMIFLHYHVLPCGLSQGEYYTLSIPFKRRFTDMVSKYGNVRYVFSGHVHCGIKSSIKTSWTFRDTNYIICPSPVSPRAFGEEYPEFSEGKDEGYYNIVEIDGTKAKVIGRKIGSKATKEYPDTFTEFDYSKDPRCFFKTVELEASDKLENGSFENGLHGWLMPNRYISDKDPGFIFTTKSKTRTDGKNALYLFCREKGMAWAYDESVEVYQVINVPSGAAPVLSAKYHSETKDKSYFGGGYIRVQGYSKEEPCVELIFKWGARDSRVRHLPQIWSYYDYGESRGVGNWQDRAAQKRQGTWTVPDNFHRWNNLRINIGQLYDLMQGIPGSYDKLNIDRLLVSCGVWCGQDPGSFSGAYFDDIRLDFNGTGESTVDNRPIPILSGTFRPEYGLRNSEGFDN